MEFQISTPLITTFSLLSTQNCFAKLQFVLLYNYGKSFLDPSLCWNSINVVSEDWQTKERHTLLQLCPHTALVYASWKSFFGRHACPEGFVFHGFQGKTKRFSAILNNGLVVVLGQPPEISEVWFTNCTRRVSRGRCIRYSEGSLEDAAFGILKMTGFPGKLTGAFVVCVILLSVVAIYSVSRQTVSLDTIKSAELNKNNTSCRWKAIRSIMATTRSTTNVLFGTEDARKCWLESLIFYLNFPLDFGYGSHVIAFLAAAWITDGAILEMGSGWYSTPVSHRISVIQERSVLTADANYDWLKRFLLFSTTNHSLYYVGQAGPLISEVVHVVDSWDAIGKQNGHWSVIFLDHAPGERRKVDLDRLRKKADLLVIHDSQPKANSAYKSQDLLSTFKYRAIIGPGWSDAYTDVLSDSRPDLVNAVRILCRWGIQAFAVLKPSRR